MTRDLEKMTNIKDVLSNLRVIKIQGVVAEIIEGRDDNSNTFVLELDEPFKSVTSSIAYDDGNGIKERIRVEDVYTIKVRQDNLPDEGFVYNPETQEFSYEGDGLKKDISGSGEVFLTNKLFSELVREGMQKRVSEKRALRQAKFGVGVKAD